jgi:3-oxoacyl-[acyl-carrier protein] reductase
MEVRLEGRTALVTGGSAGLGLAMAERFAASGARVGIVARRPDVLEAARAAVASAGDGSVVAVSADVSRPEDVARAHGEVVDALGPVDILVNNAGTAARGNFSELTDEDWQHDFDLKLFAAVRFVRLVLPGMRERRWGRIINVLNTAAKAPGAASYPTAVTRAAGLALTKSLAGEVAADNVLVNALCTGLLVSEQWESRHATAADGTSFADFVARTGRAVPLGRMGEPAEFANLACFLASDAASYLTGTAINVDGGLCPVP